LPAVTFEISEDAMIHDIRANRTAVDQQNGQTSREPLNKSTLLLHKFLTSEHWKPITVGVWQRFCRRRQNSPLV